MLKLLGLGRALRGRFLLGGCAALRLHLALVETHDVDFGYCLSPEFDASSRTRDMMQEKVYGD
jgi:hypothetical protein